MGDQDVSDYINYLQAKPVTVRSINLDGLVRVKDDVVLPHIKPLLESNTLDGLYRSKIQPLWLSYILPWFMLCYMMD